VSEDIEIRVSIKDNASRGLDAVKRQAKDTGDHIARELSRAGERAGDGFERGMSRRLGDGAEKGRGFFGRLFDGVADQASNAADAVGKSLAQIPVALSGLAASTVATGGINLLVLALLALVAAAAVAVAGLIVLAPAVYLVGGAFGATNTLAVGLAATLATLVVGLGGMGDAWSAAGQKSGGGGRSAADAAHQVRMATLALADAQREAVTAQEAVTRARMDEQERLEDLTRSLAGARLDEEGAILAVQRAEIRLRDARRNGGSALDYREAELALRQSKQTLEEVRDRVGDLGAEQDDASRKGVEGSDRVQAALRRQEMAQRQITAATYALAQAQRGAGGGVDAFAEAMAKLSPNAQAFLLTLLALRDQFAGIKRETQDKLFDGLDRSVMRLANRSFPTLRTILGSTATSLNGLAKGAMEALGDPKFLKDVGAAAGAFDRTLDRIGEKTLPKLLGAIGTLARASIPFWEELSDMALGWIEKFSDKIEAADKDGRLKTFFEDAAESLGTLRDVGGTAISILGTIVKILFPGSKRESEGFLDTALANLEEVQAWLDNPENQTKIQDWIAGLQDMGDGLGETTDKVIGIVDRIDEWTSSIGGFIDAWTWLPRLIKRASAGMFDGVKDAFKAALNWVIDRWNGLSFRLPSIEMFGTTIGGRSLDTPNIDRFDHGGIAGGLVSVAERSREAISTPGGGMLLALPQGSTVHPNGATEAMLSGGGGSQAVRVVFDITGADEEMKRVIRKWVRIEGGGNVQTAFGKG
jgi:hypothetical protein